MIIRSTALANFLLAALKDQLDGGFLYVYAGAAPASADVALDMATTHTELLKFSVGGDGTTGLTFDAPVDGSLSKAAAEAWAATASFDGAQDGETSLAPTFYRFCAAGDTGRGIADPETAPRIQGTAGGPNSGADLQFGSAAVINGIERPLGAFALGVAA